jgi:Fur family peroxide stress response transcriptional regulator
MTLEEKKKILKENGYSITFQRIAILEYLENCKAHPSVDMIYEELRKKYPVFSRATIYNNLQVLKKLGLIWELEIESGKVRFDGNPEFHPHFMCKTCGAIFDMPGEESKKLPKEIEGHLVDEIRINYYGTCARCRKKGK